MKGYLLLFVFLLVGGLLQNLQAQQTAPSPQQVETKTIKLKVTGMTCAGCANHISNALKKLDGVLGEDVQYPGDVAFVTFVPGKVDEKAIIAAIEEAGYKAELLEQGKEQK
ncbi:MAG: copper chaperone [Bacteroidetes bacterium]|nr:MAG: copper chaperone [Bacteroidota bacterium]